MTAPRLIPLPPPVRQIYATVEELERLYPHRRFTPDGHLMGSLGEVIAELAFGLTPLPMSHSGHDAVDPEGRYVQVKLTGGSSVSLYATCERLLVMRVTPDRTSAEIVYDGPGEPAWNAAGAMQKNGQRPSGA